MALLEVILSIVEDMVQGAEKERTAVDNFLHRSTITCAKVMLT